MGMTRERKLEAALRAILSAGRDGCDRCRFQDWRCWAEAREVLATPATSEWNEAIEAAATACRKHLGGGIDYSIDGAKCVEIIESLKRKEQP